MQENEKTTVPIPSVGADGEQSLSYVTNEIITTGNEEINPIDESMEEMLRQMQRMSDPSYLATMTMSQLYDTVYESRLPVIDGLLYPGTYLFVGAPKVGKSFLMAQIAYHVSTGLPLWNYSIHAGTVLYLALEDDYRRLQERLYRMFGVEGTDTLHFATCAKQLGAGLYEQLARFVSEHRDTRLIIIDTLQKIREASGDRYSYASDYEMIGQLKHFADQNYENAGQISVREFQSLFNYNYLNATRLLNDEKTDNYFSISKELLSHFKKSNDWEEFKKQIIKDIKEGLKEQKLNEKVKEHSLIKAQNALDSIEKCFEYNKGEFSLQTDISDELLLGFLSSSLQTFFEFENGTKLKEFSQGLGISNLIFMCLKVEAFVQQYQSDVVDIFVIEEPEAHMHPQMERMLIKFLNEILLNEDNNRVQGIITTHSSEIIKCSDLKNIRVLRIDKLLKSAVYDMNLFKQNLETEEERQFFSFLFSINYSDLIFANKVIMYEGDTEKLYIEKLLAEKEFEGLSNQYVSFVQVGGAYTHWYRKLVYFLKIKTLIITDIDYCKKLTSIDEIKDDDGITNAGLIQYYKDYVTVNIIKRDILPYCEHKCRKQLKDCLYEKTEMERISLIQSDFRKKPCPKIKKPDYSIMKKKPTVVDIDSWIKNPDCELIKVVSQGEADAYTRTLEEAMLCKLLGITVESKKSSDWWEKQISINKIKLDIPTRKKNITVRDILNENKNNKTDFMYSIILSELHLKALPNYIREGLIWLM